MFRLRFWLGLAVLSALMLGAGWVRVAILRARNPIEPQVTLSYAPNREENSERAFAQTRKRNRLRRAAPGIQRSRSH